MGALTPYHTIRLFKLVLQHLSPGKLDVDLFLLDIEYLFIFIFLGGKSCWIVLGIETGPRVLELSQSYLDVSAIILVRDDLVRDSFREKYESHFLVYSLHHQHEHHPDVLVDSFKCGRVRPRDQVLLPTFGATPF